MKQTRKNIVPSDNTTDDNTVLYTLAHDIKSPINQVHGLLVIARKMNISDELDALLRMALESNGKLTSRINEMLDMNLRDFEVKSIDIEELVQDISDSLKFEAAEARVHVIPSCSIEENVVTNKQRLKSIVHNLLENAIKYRDRNRTDSSVVVSCSQNGGMVIIKVSDNGLGIKPDEISQVFRAKYQANRKANGHGIGLYISRRNAMYIGGKVEVESTWGEGSTFTLTFPDRSYAP